MSPEKIFLGTLRKTYWSAGDAAGNSQMPVDSQSLGRSSSRHRPQ